MPYLDVDFNMLLSFDWMIALGCVYSIHNSHAVSDAPGLRLS